MNNMLKKRWSCIVYSVLFLPGYFLKPQKKVSVEPAQSQKITLPNRDRPRLSKDKLHLLSELL